MYVIPPVPVGVTLHRANGVSSVYSSRRHLLEALGFDVLRRRLRPYLEPAFGWNLVAVDANGQTLLAADFHDLIKPSALDVVRTRRGLIPWNGTGPVPHTGRLRGDWVFRRKIRTQHERRLHAFVDEEAGEPPVRARRNARNLPTANTDISRSSYGNHNWKRFRRTQWKA